MRTLRTPLGADDERGTPIRTVSGKYYLIVMQYDCCLMIAGLCIDSIVSMLCLCKDWQLLSGGTRHFRLLSAEIEIASADEFVSDAAHRLNEHWGIRVVCELAAKRHNMWVDYTVDPDKIPPPDPFE